MKRNKPKTTRSLLAALALCAGLLGRAEDQPQPIDGVLTFDVPEGANYKVQKKIGGGPVARVGSCAYRAALRAKYPRRPRRGTSEHAWRTISLRNDRTCSAPAIG